MPGANEQQRHSLSIREEFRSLLETEWTRQVACQNTCPIDSCSCQRQIVHVHAVEAWWMRQASENPNNTRLDRFLHEMPIPAHRNLPIKSTILISRSGNSCLRILSLLIKQGRDHLIDLFYEANIYDRYLTRGENDQDLREKLVGVERHAEVETIIGDFNREKWKWCPLNLTLDMDENLQGTKVIPPFCLKIKLSEKGGTASIYWVAVQKDLISDNALALALQDSIYTDDEFGQCYQMVLKSYCGNKREFELEKEAFSGLQSNDQIPILKYLGSYTHDYGEGKGFGKTYNLLLEYGENDLYQTWADETNVPPVQAQDILQNWRSIFDIAKAIRHVHHLEIRRGKDQPWRFHGWHADIKPDNILSVRGRLKLADFGFSSFAPVIEGHGGSEPKDVIRGFSDTYGAPEVSRMEQPDGTLSGVSQAIDAWSFGCVLSVAATWVVLGWPGVRQYERLRQLAPTNNKDGVAFDRFHNGSDVLPEVEKWHDYLREHLRLSDTTTGPVLDLIEHKLLRANPAARHNMEDLCQTLEELSDSAKYRIQSLRKLSEDTDPVVMMALKEIEEEALIQRSSEPKTNLLQQPLLQCNPRERACMQVDKEEMIRNKPLGQTMYRRQILESTADPIAEPFIPNPHGVAKPILTQMEPDVEGLLPIGTTTVRSALTNRRPKGSANPHTSNMSRRRVSIQILDREHGARTSFEKTSKTEALESKDSVKAADTEESVRSAIIASPSRRHHQSAPTIPTIPDTLVQASVTDPGASVASEGIFDTRVSQKPEPENIESIMKLSPIPQVAYVAQLPPEVQLPQGCCATSNQADTDTEKLLVGAECNQKEDEIHRAETSSGSYMREPIVQPTMRPSASEKTRWRRFIELLKKHARPAVQPGHQRIEWQCYCGDQMYGDYNKKNPVALQNFASRLQRLAHVTDPIDTSGESLDVDCKELASKPEQDTDSSPNHRGSGSGTTSNVNHNSVQSIPPVLSPQSSQLSTGTNLSSTITHSNGQSSSATSISQSGMRRQFFELCVDTYGSERATYLDEIDITKVQNDAELFHKIYESYKRLRGPRLRRLLLRPTHVHFVRFGVRKRHRACILEYPFAIPPEHEVRAGRYHYYECPLDTIPMDHNSFLHYMKKHRRGELANPSHINFDGDAIFLQRLPKKVGNSIFAHSQSTLPMGWGVHIIEDLHKEAMAWILCFLIVLSFVISILYIHYWKTQEQGFAIGQWVLSALAIAVSAVYFHFTEQ